jgi:2-methylcitrate dehydratase PrpD
VLGSDEPGRDMLQIDNTVTATTDVLAEVVADLSSDSITDSARERARLCILDTLGCATGGYSTAPAEATAAWASAALGGGDCAIWLHDRSAGTLAAAIANAAASCSLDGDDLHWESVLHVGAGLVPVAIAGAQETGASGRELLDALVIGYEVACRIGSGVDWATLGQIATGSWSCWGAAAIMARLHGGTAEDYARAFAVVGGLKPQVLPPGVGVNRNGIKEGIAWGVFTGIAAEQLSRAGLTGPRECLDNDLLNAERIAAGQPDGRFEIELTEFKPYVCCAWTHTPAEALLGLIDDHGLSAEEIERVEVATHTNAVHMIDNTPDPPTLQAAQYNIPWVLAVAAVDGVDGLLPLRESTVGRPELIQFANRVELAVDAKYDVPAQPRGARVTIDTGRGSFERDLPQDQSPDDLESLARKFRIITQDQLSAERQDRTIDAVMSLDGDIGPLIEQIAPAPDLAG